MTLQEAQKKVDQWISKYGVRYFNELADVLFVLICLANQTGTDLEKAFRNNLKKKTSRDFDRHQQNDKLR